MANNNIYNQLSEIESIPQNLLRLGITSYIKKTRTLKERASQISCLDHVLQTHSKRDEKRFASVVGYTKDHVRNSLKSNGALREQLEKQVKGIVYGNR